MRRHARVLELYPRPRIPAGGIVIDGTRMASYDYNAPTEMLSLHVEGNPARHPWADETPEGHYVMFSLDDTLNQVELVFPQLELDEHGVIAITVREDGPTERLPREVIEPLLVHTEWPAAARMMLFGR